MKKIAIISILLLAILGVTSYMSYVYFTVNEWDNLIYPGVKIEEADLTGKTKEEALNIIKHKYSDEVLKKKIKIKALDKTYTIDYSKLDARYNINDAIEQAFSYGKNKGMLEKYSLIKNTDEKQFTLRFMYNMDVINQVISQIRKEINKDPVDASITMVKRGVFQVTPEVKGYKLQEEKLKEKIKSDINGKIENDMLNIEAPIEAIIPRIKEADLKTIDTKISAYQTDFTTSSWARSENVRVATLPVNGVLLMPGDVFSFNEIVGERTKARGYKDATVLVGNKAVPGVGGGICQVSSTLYNAVIRAGLNSISRRPHTIPSSYTEKGQDATVAWGAIDYKFENTLDYPIYIEGYIYNKHLYFNLYSNKSLKKWSYKVISDVYETIEPPTKEIIPDPTKFEDEEIVEQRPLYGFKVKVYRSIYEDGSLVKQELLSTDYYKPRKSIVKKGTKKRTQPTNAPEDENTSLEDIIPQ